MLVRTKFRRLLPRSELIRDVRTVSSRIALVAPSHSNAIQLLSLAYLLKPLIGNSLIEKQEKRRTFLRGPVPKFGYDHPGSPEELTLEDMKKERSFSNIDVNAIYAINLT